MKLTKAAIVSLICATSLAHAGEPLVLRPPIPVGLVFPKLIGKPYVPSRALPVGGQMVVCLVFDVGVSGETSNISVLRSSGSTEADGLVVGAFRDRKYSPATLNGTPVAVRMIGQQYLVGSQHPVRQDVCSWDLYRPPSTTSEPSH